MIATERYFLGRELLEWWEKARGTLPNQLSLQLNIGGSFGDLTLGILDLRDSLLVTTPEFSTAPVKGENKSVAWDDLLGQAFVRAGWLRPRLDPEAFSRLYSLKRDHLRKGSFHRLEFICDTSALASGPAHWLAELFSRSADFCVADISFRELQDSASILSPSNGDQLKKRQLYLAGRRFLEFPGGVRARVRELYNEETNLMLSRGLTQAGVKSSESDTLILRTARRAIRESSQGVQCFFVTSDTHLARRAALELPAQSLVACDSQKLKNSTAYFPCCWWPDVDQGALAFSTSTLRLCWELLALANSVTLSVPGEPGRTLKFQAFTDKMWPSDYRRPWLTVEDNLSEPNRPHVALAQSVVAPTYFVDPAYLAGEPLRRRPELGKETLLDVLCAATYREFEVLEAKLQPLSQQRARDYCSLLKDLDIAERREGNWIPLPSGPELQEHWSKGDVDYLHGQFMRLASYREIVASPQPGKLSVSARAALRLAESLGFAFQLGGDYLPAAGNPTFNTVRPVILEELEASATRALSIYELLTKIFLVKLQVGPLRVQRAWDSLDRAGVFAGMEFRQGGSHDKRLEAKGVELFNRGWRVQTCMLDEVLGYRDLRLESSREG